MKLDRSIVGNTPLIKIRNGIYGKLETYNPTGSVKDRVVYHLVKKAISSGDIKKGTILCEATSGNTGISLSSIAAYHGLKCKIFMPSNMSEERKDMMKFFGAEITESSPNDFIEAIDMRDDFIKENNAWTPNQFSNLENINCHQSTTAPEIHADAKKTGISWSAFVHGSGTGGTIEGVRRYINSIKMNTKICMVQPKEEIHGIQGIGDGKDFLANPEDMDFTIKISTEDAINRAKTFAKETGILVGISSGANILASEILKKEKISGDIITMLCDRGERYMSIYRNETAF